MLRKFLSFCRALGVNPIKTYSFFKGLPWFIKDYRNLKNQLKNNSDFQIKKLDPILTNKHESSGIASGHYFHQDLLIAQKIYNAKPEKHVDVASRIDGFVAHIASFMPIEVFDIRKLESKIDNIKFVEVDFMFLKPELVNYTSSISCLHSIEHFGLGRYGDKIDVDGHLKGIDTIYKILKPGGVFYFSTPIGAQRIEFNSQRVFSVEYLLSILKDKFEIKSFSYVNDKGDLQKDVELTKSQTQNNYHCNYGCGILELIKK
ncbi:MAG: DUF268 domain-containing protein [Bacteroidia bacterium]|nr:DUF268 domain-containing protein [Bacteroidia bacterium]NNC85996.1 DUF268 domain-containing protein [Bacteroidia bacterium]NNM16019.1 DUF268 domain-containing protein [Bacteroidia bacterium]